MSILTRLRGAGDSMVMAGHTGDPVPPGWSALKRTRRDPVALEAPQRQAEFDRDKPWRGGDEPLALFSW
jgi:hypothetical protein